MNNPFGETPQLKLVKWGGEDFIPSSVVETDRIPFNILNDESRYRNRQLKSWDRTFCWRCGSERHLCRCHH